MIEENADAAAKRQEALDEYESFIGRKIFFISFFILLTALSRNQVKLGFLLAINCFIPDIIANVVAYSGQI